MDLKFILVGIALIAVGVFAAIRSSAYHFECPECGEDFQVGFLEYLYMSGVLLGKYRKATLFGDFNVVCPKCGKSNFLAMKRGRGRK